MAATRQVAETTTGSGSHGSDDDIDQHNLDIDPASSCCRRLLPPTPLPPRLDPFHQTDLLKHVCAVLSFATKQSGWRLPGVPECVSYSPTTPTSTVSDASLIDTLVSDDDATSASTQTTAHRDYLDAFLDHFINVRNYIKFERVFRGGIETTDLIVTHIISFGWTLLMDPPEDYLNLPDKGKLLMQSQLVIVMKLIRIFSRLEELASRVGQKHGIKLILQIMKSFPLCMQLQINCSASLANLASVETNRNAMLKEGCIKLVLENMARFKNYRVVQAELCATLANLSSHETNARYIIANGGCSLIVQAMRLHKSSADLQIQAFHAMTFLGKFGADVLNRCNFSDVALDSIEYHMNESELLSGLNLLNHRGKIASLIFRSMRTFQQFPMFLVTACFALAHIFFNHSVDDHIVMSNQGIQCIIMAMQKHPYQGSLQTTGMFALSSIVMKNVELHSIPVLEHNGIQMVIDAMGREYNRKSLKKEGLSIECSGRTNGTGGTTVDADEDIMLESELVTHYEVEAVDQETERTPDELADQTGEPIAHTRPSYNTPCPRPLLLQLFGCVTLLNLSESIKCRNAIIERGGINYIFEASRRLNKKPELRIIIYNIFIKFISYESGPPVAYMRRKGPPSLVELAKVAIMKTVAADISPDRAVSPVTMPCIEITTLPAMIHDTPSSLPLPSPPQSPSTATDETTTPAKLTHPFIDPSYRGMIKSTLSALDTPIHLRRELAAFHPCMNCGAACFESAIRMYKITRNQGSLLTRLCSVACAMRTEKFALKTLFWYDVDVEI